MQKIIEKLNAYDVGFELRRIGNGGGFSLNGIAAKDDGKNIVAVRYESGNVRKMKLVVQKSHPKTGMWRAKYATGDSRTSIWSVKSSFLGHTAEEALEGLLADYETNVLPLHLAYREAIRKMKNGEDVLIDLKTKCVERGGE